MNLLICMSIQNELSIVIITYNNYKLKNGTIETLLLSLDAQSDIVFDVIVGDFLHLNISNEEYRGCIRFHKCYCDWWQ